MQVNKQTRRSPTLKETVAELEKLVRGPFKRVDRWRIDCQLQHPAHGLIPFTAYSKDVEEHGRLIYKIAAKQMAASPPEGK